MKQASLSLLLLCLFSACARAGHPVIVDINTDPSGVRYFLNNEPKTMEEVQQFLRQLIADYAKNGIYQDGVFVRPDKQTLFTTVFDVLRCVRAAGIKRCDIIGAETSTPLIVTEQDFPREEPPSSVDVVSP